MSSEDQAKFLIQKKVTDYLDITKKIKVLQKELKELKAAQKMIDEEIIKFMRENEIPQFQFKEGELLKLIQKTSKSSIKESWIKEKLSKADNQDDLLDYIKTIQEEIDGRETKVNFSLKHVKK